MKEFMLLIRNEGDGKAHLSPQEHQQFLQACESYIGELKKKGMLISSQPLIREGKMVSGSKGAFKEGPYSETTEIIVGYYHILANNLDEAVAVAQRNPEFAFSKKAKIEVRPIKMVEQSTSFVYPSSAEAPRR